MTKVAIFASGSGTNAENIIKHFQTDEKIEIACIITNKKDAFVRKRAENLNIESVYFSREDFLETPNVLKYLIEKKINFIVLAGFLLKIPQNIINIFPQNIINIHPALLPKYGGKGMYGDNVHKAVVENKENETGITIHYVNENYDEGTIIFQAKCPVLETDDYEDVAKKVHALEYTHFPIVIENILKSKCFY